MNEEQFEEWSKYITENYDPRLPITITIPFRQGRFMVDAEAEAAVMILEKLIKGEK